MARFALLVAWALALFFMSACDRSSSESTANGGEPTPLSDNDLARALMLTLEDFPPGWVHRPPQPEEQSDAWAPDALKPCLSTDFGGKTSELLGGEYSDENTTRLSINPAVYVFEDETSAAAGARSLIAQRQCFADVVGDGMDVNDQFAFGATYTEPLDPASFGADVAIRFYGTQIYKDLGDSDVLVFDTVVLVNGRIVYHLDGFQRHEPIDSELLKRYVDVVREKLDANDDLTCTCGGGRSQARSPHNFDEPRSHSRLPFTIRIAF